MTEPSSRPPRKGLGCLPGLFLLGILALVAITAFNAAFDPWIYTVGGRFRAFPIWQGAGSAPGPGGAYRLYVLFYPTRPGQTVMPLTAVAGDGYLCTPRGERIRLKVSGGAKGLVWSHMDGHEFHLRAWRPAKVSIDPQVERPRLYLTGRWVGPDLVLNDNASLAHFFRPDGSLDPKAGYWHAPENGVNFTLTEARWWPGAARCPSPQAG